MNFYCKIVVFQQPQATGFNSWMVLLFSSFIVHQLQSYLSYTLESSNLPLFGSKVLQNFQGIFCLLKVYYFLMTYFTKGAKFIFGKVSFNNHVDKIFITFDPLPPSVDNFT